ncbi:MAG: putative transporter [Bacteroidaceae bacterium]|nr:putative transporter [Bacteroidaceae bacterium]
MDFIMTLLEGAQGQWSGGIAHSMIILALTIAFGVMLGRIKIAGISFGVTWILFVGIFFSHFGYTLNGDLLHFVKEFGLILFVFSIGLQVGPSFFSSFKSGGLTLCLVTCAIVLFDVLSAIGIYFATDTPITTVTGILSGAVTNTPGLGAAQQAYREITGTSATDIALGYSVAYPLGVIGCILSMLAIKGLFYKKDITPSVDNSKKELSVEPLTIRVINPAIVGKTLEEIRRSQKYDFVVSRILHATTGEMEIANSNSTLQPGDKFLVIAHPSLHESLLNLFGTECIVDWNKAGAQFKSRKIIVTNPKLNGVALSKLSLRSNFQVNLTRVNRAGIDLVASPELRLQMGDIVTVVGLDSAVGNVKRILGDSRKHLDHPNIISIFIGIALGCALGSLPIFIPGMSQPVKLGLAGGPLVVAILISYFGPKYKIVTYTTVSANLMIREIGISLFLACVGLEAGKAFVDTLVNNGGLWWVLYGAIITVTPLIIAGILGRFILKIPYNTLIGVMSGSCTNPPALAFANEQNKNSDNAAVGYATVYPLAMFLRILTAQLLILIFC